MSCRMIKKYLDAPASMPPYDLSGLDKNLFEMPASNEVLRERLIQCRLDIIVLR